VPLTVIVNAGFGITAVPQVGQSAPTILDAEMPGTLTRNAELSGVMLTDPGNSEAIEIRVDVDGMFHSVSHVGTLVGTSHAASATRASGAARRRM